MSSTIAAKERKRARAVVFPPGECSNSRVANTPSLPSVFMRDPRPWKIISTKPPAFVEGRINDAGGCFFMPVCLCIRTTVDVASSEDRAVFIGSDENALGSEEPAFWKEGPPERCCVADRRGISPFTGSRSDCRLASENRRQGIRRSKDRRFYGRWLLCWLSGRERTCECAQRTKALGLETHADTYPSEYIDSIS